MAVIFTIALLTGILLVSVQADGMSKDMRPNTQGTLTANNGETVGVAEVLQTAQLEIVPYLSEEQLAVLQFVSFDLQGDRYFFKIAAAIRKNVEVQTDDGPLPVVDLFFVSGPFTKLSMADDIEVSYTNGTSLVVDNGGADKRRRLASVERVRSV